MGDYQPDFHFQASAASFVPKSRDFYATAALSFQQTPKLQAGGAAHARKSSSGRADFSSLLSEAEKTRPGVARRYNSKRSLEYNLPLRSPSPVLAPKNQSTLQFTQNKHRVYHDLSEDELEIVQVNPTQTYVNTLEARLGAQISQIMDRLTQHDKLSRKVDSIQSQIVVFREQMIMNQEAIDKLNKVVQSIPSNARNTSGPLSPPVSPTKNNSEAVEESDQQSTNIDEKVQSIQNIVAVLVDHFEALRRNLDSLDEQTNEAHDKLVQRVKNTEKNAIARTQNTYVATAGEELAPFVNIHTGQPIPKFPKTPKHIGRLDNWELNGVLSDAGCDILGTKAEKQAKLRALVGLLEAPEERA